MKLKLNLRSRKLIDFVADIAAVVCTAAIVVAAIVVALLGTQ